MNIEIEGKEIRLEDLLSPARTLITLGRKSDEAYNVIAIDNPALHTFQCQFSHTADGQWKLHNGQWRTDCPKGIRSRLQHACNLCMGRCVNVHPGRPTYGWRFPSLPTLLNGNEIATEGMLLSDGDVIEVGENQFTIRNS